MFVVKGLIYKTFAIGVLSTASLAFGSAIASAQQVTDFNLPVDSNMFSQSLTDAVTQGFRQEQDRLFFQEGIQQFEHEIHLLQSGADTEIIFNIDPVFDDWQSLESSTSESL